MNPFNMTNSFAHARFRAISFAALATGTLVLSAPATALPVIPGGSGFGIETPAGRGGAVYRVTNLNESGTGSLGACVSASGPRVCVFEVSGTIRLTKNLQIKNPNITIAGQTAPSPGIMLRGAGLWVMASDVLVQHIRVRPGDDTGGPAPENRDALVIDSANGTPVKNIVIDHCSFQWAIDETASAYWKWDNITFSNSIFAEALNDSLHPKGAHGYGVIFGHDKTGSVSMIGNLLAHQVDRNPLSRAPRLVFVNNVVYNRKYYDVDLQGRGTASENSIAGNVFIRGKDHSNASVNVIQLGGYIYPLLQGSSLYVADNAATGATNDPWSLVSTSALQMALPVLKLLQKPSSWPSGLAARSTASNLVLDSVLASAGARPLDRDPVDARIVRSVRDRTGGVVNCVAANGTPRCEKNAGGWPVLAQNQRKLTLPENPNAVNSTGYTNLEVWLHKMAMAVERNDGVLSQAVIAAPRATVN